MGTDSVPMNKVFRQHDYPIVVVGAGYMQNHNSLRTRMRFWFARTQAESWEPVDLIATIDFARRNIRPGTIVIELWELMKIGIQKMVGV